MFVVENLIKLNVFSTYRVLQNGNLIVLNLETNVANLLIPYKSYYNIFL